MNSWKSKACMYEEGLKEIGEEAAARAAEEEAEAKRGLEESKKEDGTKVQRENKPPCRS